MSSDRKVAANRRNAQKSTGPRTPSGKAVASMNALKHGLCARKPLIPGENEAEFTEHVTGWVDHLKPAGPHQSLLAEQIITAQWQLRRVPLMEAGLFARYMRSDGQHPFALEPEAYAQLSRLDRHMAALQRTIERAMKELRQLQEEEETTDYADYADEIQNEATGEQPEPAEALSERCPPTPSRNSGPGSDRLAG